MDAVSYGVPVFSPDSAAAKLYCLMTKEICVN